MAKLGEVCTIVSGSTPKTSVTSYWDGNIKWITPAELNEDTFYIMDSVRHITEEGKEKTGLSYLPTGTVILSSRAPIGKTAIAGCKMCCNQGFKNLICSDAIYNEYLYFFLKSKTDYLNSLGRGATFKEISKSIVENIEIPLPEVNQQKEIAEKFKKLEQLISLRKQQLAKLDELVKARFVEMFGDPIRNDKHFVQKTGKSLFCFSSGKFLQEEKRFQHGFPVYGGNGITWYTDIPLVKKPTIIIGRVGAYCGNVRMVNVPVWITDNAIYIKEFKTRELNLHFLLMLMKYMKFSNYADYSGQPKITQKPLETLIYIVPPLELQNRFAAFVERVDQQKQTVQQSLEKLELMKKALMQEYFG